MLLGRSGTGKTVFGGQLLGRLLYAPGALSLARPAIDSLQEFQDVLDILSEGRLPKHTDASVYTETRLELVDEDGRGVEVHWPDYGGEQIRAVARDRYLSPAWEKRIQQSDGWLLFLRLSRLRIPDDALERGMGLLQPASAELDGPPDELSDQASIIELLQILRYVHGAHARQKRRAATPPALGVVLSAIDEVLDSDRAVVPSALLQERLPLVSEFVRTRWPERRSFVMGLSALGKPLDEVDPDPTFQEEGAETQGEVILPDGSRSSDLTLPISLLLERIR